MGKFNYFSLFSRSILTPMVFGICFSVSYIGNVAAVSGDLVVYTNRGDLIDNGSYIKWVKQFKDRYPKIGKVTLKRSDNYEVESVQLFAERSYGDVAMVPENVPKDVYSNYFEPLNDLGLSEHLYFNDAWAYDGKEYGYSQGVSVEGLVYNKAIFSKLKLNVPTTLEQLYEVAEKIAVAGITPLSMNIGASWPLQQWDKAPIAIAQKADYYDDMLDDMQPFRDGAPYGKSLKIAYDFYNNGWVEQNIIEDGWEGSKTRFVNGKAAMFFLGSWVIPQLIDRGIASEYVGFAPFPFSNDDKQVGLINKDWGFAVSKFSKNKTAAKAWLKFLLTESDFADQSGFIPTDKRKKARLAQMREFQSYQPLMVQTQSPSFQFIRLTNMSGIEFMRGSTIRDVLLSSNFEKALQYWNKRWSLAIENSNE